MEPLADAGTALLSPPLRRRGSYRALECSPSRAQGGVTFSLEPPCEEEGAHHVLDACFLCRRPFGASFEVFMYRGDTPFCSEECRQEQIELDEAREREMRFRRRRHQNHRAATATHAPASARQNVCAPASDAIVAG